MTCVVLSIKERVTNPYGVETIAEVNGGMRPLDMMKRGIALSGAIGIGVANNVAALVDAYREGYSAIDGYIFISVATQIPVLIGWLGMLATIFRKTKSYWIWFGGVLATTIPGLLIWTICASMPVPRLHTGAGQMHIFFFPIIHIAYCFLIYLGTALMTAVVQSDIVLTEQSDGHEGLDRAG